MASLRAKLKDLFTPAQPLSQEAFEQLQRTVAQWPGSGLDPATLNARDWRQRYNQDGTPGGWIGHGARVALDAEISADSIIDGKKTRIKKHAYILSSYLSSVQIAHSFVTKCRLEGCTVKRSMLDYHEGVSSAYCHVKVESGRSERSRLTEVKAVDSRLSSVKARYSSLEKTEAEDAKMDNCRFKRCTVRHSKLSDRAFDHEVIEKNLIVRN
jgi:hypothetical protein